MRKRFPISARMAMMLAAALGAGTAVAQQAPDLPLQGVPKDCVTQANGERVCKPPANALPGEGNAGTDVPNGGCWLEEGNWMCEPPAQQ